MIVLRRWPVVLLLLVGIALWLLSGNDMPPLRWIIVLAASALPLLPSVNRTFEKWLDKLREPSAAVRWKIAWGLGAVAAGYLAADALFQNRDLFPKMHDECSYALGAQMLAHGHLWMPMHPLADFFETISVLVRPVYCSAYFPGTALMFAPMVWLHLPAWVLPVIVSGAIAGLLYRILTELLDGVSGLLAAVWLVSLAEFRTLSVMLMSHLALMLLGLLMVWAWLRWRKSQGMGWALLLGVLGGWAAITRPADAVVFALPIGIAMLVSMWRGPFRRLLVAACCLVAGALPFLLLQVRFDVGVTGHAFQTPFGYSLERDQPGVSFGFRQFDPSMRPASSLPEKLGYYRWTQWFLQQHQTPWAALRRLVRPWEEGGGLSDPRLVMLADATLPSRLLLVFLPVGLLALTDRRRLVVVSMLPLFLLIYLCYPYFFLHYCLIVLPAMMLLVLAGCRAIAAAWPAMTFKPEAVLVMLVLSLSITSLWEIKRIFPHPEGEPLQDGIEEAGPVAAIGRELPRRIGGRAVVLFETTNNFMEEPVYNFEAPWPDDCRIIRAHDLGPRDGEIIRYYAERQPDRMFYACDPNNLHIEQLGTARELLEKVKHKMAQEPSPR